MSVCKILISVFLSAALAMSALSVELDKWETADRETVRLTPSDFPNLPKGVRNDLDTRGCTIPQLYLIKDQPHNVISGHFKHSTQLDWAVLCSIERYSTLLVYWGDKHESILKVNTTADKRWLQGIGGGNIGFSHGISTVDAKYITDHARRYDAEVPSVLDHEGIADAFIGKASVIRYWYKGGWLALQGAD